MSSTLAGVRPLTFKLASIVRSARRCWCYAGIPKSRKLYNWMGSLTLAQIIVVGAAAQILSHNNTQSREPDRIFPGTRMRGERGEENNAVWQYLPGFLNVVMSNYKPQEHNQRKKNFICNYLKHS